MQREATTSPINLINVLPSIAPRSISSFMTLPFGLGGRFLLSLLLASLGTATLIHLTESRPSWQHALTHFWLEDLPPMTGSMRIFFYSALLITAYTSSWARPHLGDSPLQAPELKRYTLPRFFSLEGAMKLMLPPRWTDVNTVTMIRNTTLLAFILCIIGAGGQLPPIIVGIGMVLLHGVAQGCIGTSHRWYVPVYTCLALMAANGNAEWSVDAWMYKQYGDNYPFKPPCWSDNSSSASASTASPSPVPSLLCSSYSRKMVLLSAMSTLFFGCVTKLLNGGLGWIDGRSLAYYVSSEENGRSMWLKSMMNQYRSLSLLLSIGSLLLEGGSVVAAFVPWSRVWVIMAAAGLHLGIWLTMWPNYFPQTLCYILAMTWPWERDAGVAYSFAPWSSSAPSSLRLAIWIGVWIWFFLSCVALFRIECWPLTGIPMYSFYRDCSKFNYKFLRDIHQAQGVAREHEASGYPNAIAWSNVWINLRIKNTSEQIRREKEEKKRRRMEEAERGITPSTPTTPTRSSTYLPNGPMSSSEREYVNLKSRVTDRRFTRNGVSGVYLKQYRRTLHNIAAKDMACKPMGHIEVHDPVVRDGSDALEYDMARSKASDSDSSFQPYPALQWLRTELPHLRATSIQNDWKLPSWVDESGELQLRVKLKDRYAILAAIPWNYQQQKQRDDEDEDERESSKEEEQMKQHRDIKRHQGRDSNATDADEKDETDAKMMLQQKAKARMGQSDERREDESQTSDHEPESSSNTSTPSRSRRRRPQTPSSPSSSSSSSSSVRLDSASASTSAPTATRRVTRSSSLKKR